MLLEADKAYLIISEEDRRLFRADRNTALPPRLVTDFIAEKSSDSEINRLRSEIRLALNVRLTSDQEMPRLSTLTLPTGSGKTSTLYTALSIIS